MPFLDTTTNQDMLELFNLTTAVGNGAPNDRDDVALVQYFLLKAYGLPGWTRPRGELKIDGIYGPVTHNWIVKYQIDARTRRKHNVLLDGRVDRLLHHPGRTVSSSITGTLYTICSLNRVFQAYYPDEWSVLRTGRTVTLEVLQGMYAATRVPGGLVLLCYKRLSGMVIALQTVS